jgi:hypothetical protein
MKRVLIFCVIATVFLGCTKDKFKTVPQVEIKSFGPDEVHKGDFITLRAIVRDKEGDLQDSVLLVRKRFTGTVLLPPVDTMRLSIKDFMSPEKSEIEISAVFSYGEIRDGFMFQNLENSDKNFSIGVIVTDNAGHRSDYVESNQIVLKKL